MKSAFLPVKRRRIRKRLHTISAESDEAVLARFVQTRQREDFAQLVYRYEKELFHYLKRYLGDAAEAEDVFQATFLQVYLNCQHFQADRRFRPWLYSIATNQAIDARRRNRRHKALSLDLPADGESQDLGALMNLISSSSPNPAQQVSAEEQAAWVRNALEQLPEPFRGTVILAYYQGLKYHEVAEALQVPIGTVRSRLHSATVKLLEMWNKQHKDQP